MQVQRVNNQNFGMAVKYNPSEFVVKNHILANQSKSKALKSENIISQLLENRATTNLNLVKDGNKTRLQASVGGKVVKENFFNSPYRVLKKTLNESKEESQIELIADVLKILAKDS
jgi:hypothetical protein